MKALVASLCLVSSLALAAEPSLTLVFEGDNGAEVAPCGCKGSPTGGLPRRKTALQGLDPKRSLIVDTGNALFANAGAASDAEKARARFVYDVMEELGTRLLAVGQRDLAGGTAFLLELSRGRRLQLLSANLERDGKRLFPASAVLEVNGLKVAFIGLTLPGPVAPNEPTVRATGTVDAVRAALKTLGRRDLTVVLAATSYPDSMQLAQQLGSAVDLVIQSGEFRGTQPPQRLTEGGPLLLASGQKGQAVGKLELRLGKKAHGPLIDLGVTAREQQELELVDSQLATLQQRVDRAKDPAAKAELLKTVHEVKARRRELEREVAKTAPPDARTAKLEWIVLGGALDDDPALKQRVLEFEPTFAGAH